MGSQMHLKYIHYFGNESKESILEAQGLKPKADVVLTDFVILVINPTPPI